MWHNYYSVTSIDEALQILAERGEQARIVAGGDRSDPGDWSAEFAEGSIR